MNNIEAKKHKKIRKKETLRTLEAKTIKTLIITLSLMIVFLTSSFLAITSQSAQNGYALEQEKERYELLLIDKEKLQTKITSSTAYGSIEDSQKVNSMQEEKDKTFITAEDLL